MKKRLAILISGRGSNMAAIAQACASGRLDASIELVIADRPTAAGVELAQSLGLSTQCIAFKDFPDRPQFEQGLVRALEAAKPDLILLAGFMRILTADFVGRYAGRLINIHPSLLPAFPGLKTHARALEAGVSEHGATVHWVEPELDHGPAIMQVRVPVLPTDTEASLAARVLEQEHELYCAALERVFLNNQLIEKKSL
jgi:phosphoribosylglycinamide formyltransferase 1